MKCLKKITNLALANEWITKDPFVGIKFHEKEVVREFLTMDELLTIYHKDFPLERIRIVRDVFIFAAFTGLARTVICGFASLVKRPKICATFLYLIFRWKFFADMQTIRFVKRKMYCCQFHATRR